MAEYDFQQLSPTDFERLTRDVLDAEFGWSLQDYGPGADGGIDLRHEDPDGTVTIVQCKHYARSAASTLLKAAAKEGKRNPPLHADRYLFVTSQSLSPRLQDDIKRALGGLPVRNGDIWGREALNKALEDHPTVERRHVKLWLTSAGVLDTFFHAGRLNRADAEIEFAADNWKLWVEADEVEAARSVLENKGFCAVYGPPGAGKTTLARMVLLSMLREGWQLVPVSGDVEEAWDAWDRHDDVRQVFWFDDFLGERVAQLGKNEDARLRSFVARVAAGRERRLLMTVREQTLGEARASTSEHLRELARWIGADAGVRVGSYPERVRRAILLNHLYFSDLPDAERERVAGDNRVLEIVRHPGYSPRLVSVGLSEARERTADGVLDGISRALDHPDEVWETSFGRLSSGHQRVLLALATLPPRPWPLELVLRLAGADDTVAWKPARKVLVPTWLTQRRDGVELANPSCREYLLDYLDDPVAAARCVARVRLAEQAGALTRAAGLLGGSGVSSVAGIGRPELAAALRARSAEFAALIRFSVADDSSPWELRDAAELLAVYGSDSDFGWLAERVAAVAASVDLDSDGDFDGDFGGEATAVFDLAAVLANLPSASRHEQVARQAVLNAIPAMKTTHDLDAYETLSSSLRTPSASAAARERAREIIAGELDYLLRTGTDPEVMRTLAAEATARAAWYGISSDIDVTPLLDRAEDLEWERHGGGPS